MNYLNSQLNALKNIPGEVLSYWPAFFTFAVVDYATVMIQAMIPYQQTGPVGLILRSATSGFGDVARFATWDQVKNAGVAHM